MMVLVGGELVKGAVEISKELNMGPFAPIIFYERRNERNNRHQRTTHIKYLE